MNLFQKREHVEWQINACGLANSAISLLIPHLFILQADMIVVARCTAQRSADPFILQKRRYFTTRMSWLQSQNMKKLEQGHPNFQPVPSRTCPLENGAVEPQRKGARAPPKWTSSHPKKDGQHFLGQWICFTNKRALFLPVSVLKEKTSCVFRGVLELEDLGKKLSEAQQESPY